MTRRHEFRRVVLVLGLSTASAFGRGGGSPASASAPPSTAALFSQGDTPTDRAIGDAQQRLANTPGDARAKKALAAGFLQKVREYADPTYYTKADQILATLGGAQSNDPEVLLLQGSLLLAKHQFTDALKVGQRIVREWPNIAGAQAILVDALNEMGRYDEALAATERMATLRPDLAALARISYARELRGDVPGAILAMEQAVSASGGVGEPGAYVRTLLGNLFLAQGRVKRASDNYAAALRSFPGFASARAGQAAVLYASGKAAQAAALISQVVEAQPLAQYAIAEGDYFMAAGMTAEATNAYQLVDAIVELSRSNGVNVDIEMAIYEADHHPKPSLVESTRRAARERPGVTAHHAFAWVLHRLGRHREASEEIAKVIAVGDRDPVFRFHAAAIAAAAGDRRGATEQLDMVLRSNPRALGIKPSELESLAKSLGRSVPAPAS
jgi:tetratricopeptide (TPR) repeat protein